MNRRQELDDRIGTCPTCWGEFKVRDDDADGRWSLALHGYLRPGDGFIRGQCAGTGEEPLEHSSSGLVAAINRMTDEIAIAPGSDEQRAVVEERLQFAEQELAIWSRRAIPGIDIDPIPFQARRPPDPSEIRDRLRLGVPLHGNLDRATREEVQRVSEARSPRIEITFQIRDPTAAARHADRERVSQLKPEMRYGIGERLKNDDDRPKFRLWLEAELALSVEESRLAVDRDRHRLALGRTAAAWLTAIGVAAQRPESTISDDQIRARVVVPTPTWEEADRIGRSLRSVGDRKASPGGLYWNVDLDDLRSLGLAIGVEPADPRQMKSALKVDPPPAYPTWESVRNWDGGQGEALVAALNWYQARLEDAEWLWRIPAALARFIDPAILPWQPVAVDAAANAIYRDATGIWRLEPIEGLYADTDLSDDEVERLQDLRVIAVSKDRMALIPAKGGSGSYASVSIVSVGELLQTR